MKRATRVVTLLLGIAMVAFLISGCLITEVIQSLVVAAGGEFTTKVTITDKTADANAHEGALAILTPDDWEFVSGTYDSQVGKGAFILDVNNPPVYGDLDGKLPAPAGMKWIRLVTDAGYTNDANVVHEANITLKVGTKTGDFMIGYMATKNSPDMLGSINVLNEDNDNAWADTSMNHMVTVTGAAAAGVMFNEAFSRGSAEAPDYVELYNPSAAAVDVSGYKVYDNGGQAGSKPKKELPAGSVIAPWGFMAITVDNTGADSDFGLSSGGDKVWLENTTGAVIDSVEFGAMQPTESWQRIPDGGAYKLSSPITRGTSNLPVKLNEAYSRGTDTDPDWVEIYNSCADTLDVSGYKVYDNGGQAGTKPKKEVPAGTLLPPKGLLVIVVDKTGADSDFGLGSGGDKVWLEDAAGAVVDSVEFGALEPTQSWARKPDAGLWQITDAITKGTPNGDPTGVATEPRVVEGYSLRQNYPNPFNPSTKIDFVLPRTADVQVAVYNLRGEMVAELVNGRLAAGSHQLTFNADGLASGIYIYAIRSAEFATAKRMVLMK